VVAYWAQGFGSIAAVAVAIYVPWKIQNRAMEEAKQERDLKARSLAILIWPAVLELKALIVRGADIIEMKKRGASGAAARRGGGAISGDAQSDLRSRHERTSPVRRYKGSRTSRPTS
jgi:hypothetical protein